MSYKVKQWAIADGIMKMPEGEVFTVKKAREVTGDPVFHPSIGNALSRFINSNTKRYGCRLSQCGFDNAKKCKQVKTYRWDAI